MQIKLSEHQNAILACVIRAIHNRAESKHEWSGQWGVSRSEAGELYGRKGGSPVECNEFTGGNWHTAHPPGESLFLSQQCEMWIIYII